MEKIENHTKRNVIFNIAIIVILLIVSGLNILFKIIYIPEINDVIQKEIDYITISTVFIGFAFTSLGILLGMSSEKLIQKIKNTDIIILKVQKIVNSIVFLIISISVSIYYIIGLNRFFFGENVMLGYIDQIIYVFGLCTLVVGIIFFAVSIFELYGLIKKIYDFNVDKNIVDSNDRAIEQIKKEREKYENAKFE